MAGQATPNSKGKARRSLSGPAHAAPGRPLLSLWRDRKAELRGVEIHRAGEGWKPVLQAKAAGQ